METRTKTFGAVAESRKWKEPVGRATEGMTREEVLASRKAQIPLSNVVGTAWDVANAALFLASDEAKFITGAELVVDGGQTLLVG